MFVSDTTYNIPPRKQKARNQYERKTKIITYQTVDQVSNFICLRNDIGCDVNYDIDIKLGKYQRICGATDRVFFRNKILREAKLKFYTVKLN